MRRTWTAVLLVFVSASFLASGSLTAGMRASSGSGSASADRFELYVDALRGDDSGNCRMVNTPCRSIRRALDNLPAVMRRDVVIRIAPGEYPGEVVIEDRLSWDLRSLTLIGVATESILDGGATQRFGIMISGSADVVIEGLTIRKFAGDGLIVARTESVSLHDVDLTQNGGHGLSARQSEISLRGARIDGNWGDGIHCRQGWLTVQRHDRGDGLFVLGNSGYGLRATGCEVRFEGAAQFRDNAGGLFAEHGAEIDLGGQNDIVLSRNTRVPGSGQGPLVEPARPPVGINEAVAGCEMIADHHGVILGYSRAIIDGACTCGESGYGICQTE